jgi:hypothetical protein
VDEDSTPTPEDVKRLGKHADPSVGSQSLTDWYVLLRNTQGNPAAVLEAGMMTDGEDFLQDSLFCEWAYVMNLDTLTLEIYKGFQTKPHTRGRYAQIPVALAHRLSRGGSRADTTYYPVALTAKIPFEEVPIKLSSILSDSGRRKTRRERKRARRKAA